MDQQDALPPLPKRMRLVGATEPPLYSPDQMRDYALAAVLAERLRCASICRSRYMGDNTREDVEARACAEAILKG